MKSAARGATARGIAATVIARVQRDGAFASAVLDAEIERYVQLEVRDRAFATELVYGSLRVLPWLEGEIGRRAPRGIEGLDPRVRATLVVAAYQLFFTRVPAFAAVSEAVEAVRAQAGPRVAAFANAVLRRLAEGAAEAGEAVREEATLASVPDWLRAALERALSPEGARAFLRCGLESPPVALRVEQPGDRDLWLSRLRAAVPSATFEPGRVSPGAILVLGAGKPQALPGWREGAWSVQEEGSQFAALAVEAREGEAVLDACAGRGNKTAILLRQVGARGAVDVCDASVAKLDRLAAEVGRLGLAPRRAFAVDWRAGSGEVSASYDRVLVDAPCTGTGTLRRRPEIGLRRTAVDLAELTRTQVAIASRAAGHVRPGGVLVFAVCSVLREEAEDVVDALLRARPELSLEAFESSEIRRVSRDAASVRLLPEVHGTDGYFLARLRSRASSS